MDRARRQVDQGQLGDFGVRGDPFETVEYTSRDGLILRIRYNVFLTHTGGAVWWSRVRSEGRNWSGFCIRRVRNVGRPERET